MTLVYVFVALTLGALLFGGGVGIGSRLQGPPQRRPAVPPAARVESARADKVVAEELAERRRIELQAAADELADWIDAHPTIEVAVTDSLNYCSTAAEVAAYARVLGRVKKKPDGDYMGIVRYFGPIKVEAYTSRENVCRKVVTGTREIPEQVIPARTEELVTWVCDEPLLAHAAPEEVEAA